MESPIKFCCVLFLFFVQNHCDSHINVYLFLVVLAFYSNYFVLLYEDFYCNKFQSLRNKRNKIKINTKHSMKSVCYLACFIRKMLCFDDSILVWISEISIEIKEKNWNVKNQWFSPRHQLMVEHLITRTQIRILNDLIDTFHCETEGKKETNLTGLLTSSKHFCPMAFGSHWMPKVVPFGKFTKHNILLVDFIVSALNSVTIQQITLHF